MGGAKKGGFAHNTGEGGISSYHLKNGGDLIWQIGTGYFGARTKDGKFCKSSFQERASLDSVKMIEIKLSQGAKPGHGGILPASKNTPEIAKIRGVEPHTTINSPSYHTAFSNNYEMLKFIEQLRELSGGKPVGIKFCLGIKEEFIQLCSAMFKSNIKPDFITVDGGEGGTGAAPLEYSNSVGHPLREGLSFVIDMLNGFDLKKDIIVNCSGKVVTGFHIARSLALGADICNSARSMMMALGCIQALECNNNSCPVGVATQSPKFTKGLIVEDKINRVANYHDETIHSFVDLLSSVGLNSADDLQRHHVNIRTNIREVMRYDELYPPVAEGTLSIKKTRTKHTIHI